ncbi:uncharacterized protein LOC133851346 isoform X1 [Alnus glutinosa]|uniref:uncharacterized protein LOC133851346 isoform X1 n=1 Tax=Alnus glutinosa TaxID=3517 RepID=UPI002D765BDC|nr:uncharacterized protein LOC133851346 isoform X1 [Alnus glutinosa]
MDDFPKVLCGWSWEENKLFELALAVVDEQDPDRWEVVAAMVGGKKSPEDVQKHYVILLEDLQVIESGKLDHKLGEAQPCVQVDCSQSICWTDEDNKLVLSSTVYGIWRARNETKYHGKPKTEEQILKIIFWEVRSRISGKGKFKKNRENVSICQNWNLDVNILV